jgi:UDP-N-acetylmuramoylalanine--D-glutamate ligase
MNQTEDDYLIYDADDEAIRMAKTIKRKAKLIPFSLTKTFNEGAFIQNNKMEVNINQDEFLWNRIYCIRRKT